MSVQFSSLEPEILCRLVFVKDVQFTTDQAVAAQPGPGERTHLLCCSVSTLRQGVTHAHVAVRHFAQHLSYLAGSMTMTQHDLLAVQASFPGKLYSFHFALRSLL